MNGIEKEYMLKNITWTNRHFQQLSFIFIKLLITNRLLIIKWLILKLQVAHKIHYKVTYWLDNKAISKLLVRKLLTIKLLIIHDTERYQSVTYFQSIRQYNLFQSIRQNNWFQFNMQCFCGTLMWQGTIRQHTEMKRSFMCRTDSKVL